MWHELIETITNDCEFFSGATNEQIASLENALKANLTDELKSLLFETNGILGKFGLGLIWTVDRIIINNLQIRNDRSLAEIYMPFDALLFFADAGNGDQFALRVINGAAVPKGVFVWDHENDSRKWVAPSIRRYLEWWLTGKLSV